MPRKNDHNRNYKPRSKYARRRQLRAERLRRPRIKIKKLPPQDPIDS